MNPTDRSWLSTVMTPEKVPTFDFTEYGTPVPEWQAFVAHHPEKGRTAKIPADETVAQMQLQSRENEERSEQSRSNIEAKGLEDNVTVRDTEIRGGASDQERLTARVYTRNTREDELRLDKVPGVVYYHGGGYVFGTPDTERYLCSLLASRLRVVVVHICYRQALQHPHPAAHEDGKDGFEWVVENAERFGIDPAQIVVVGLSAGAAIAASTTLRVCNEDAKERQTGTSPRPGKRKRTDDGKEGSEQGTEPLEDDIPGGTLPDDKVVDRSCSTAGRVKPKGRIKGLLLIVPWLLQENAFPYHLFRSREGTSRVQCAQPPSTSKAVYDQISGMLAAQDKSDPLLNVPLVTDEELQRFPRTAFMIAGMDFFRDDGLILAEKLRVLG